jgi:hypothetical protein
MSDASIWLNALLSMNTSIRRDMIEHLQRRGFDPPPIVLRGPSPAMALQSTLRASADTRPKRGGKQLPYR